MRDTSAFKKERRPFFLLWFLVMLGSYSNKPSEKEISQKILQDYVCPQKARVNKLKILKTGETKSTNGPHVFRYSVRGEVEWPNGCSESGTNTPQGTKEKFERLVTLYKTEEGTWQ